MFYLKQQGASASVMSECGASVPVTRMAGPFPKLPLEESAKKWQKSFFYVRNVDPADDRINLPPFVDVPSAEKLNWGHNSRNPSVEIVGVCRRVKEMTDLEGLAAVDLIAAFIGRQVLPLQWLPHRICDMSGRRDPYQLSTKELTLAEIAQRVNDVSAAGLKVKEWRFGKEPYGRDAPVPAHFPSQLVYDSPNPMVLQPDRDDSNPEEEGDGDAGAGGGEERLANAKAGGSDQTAPPDAETGDGAVPRGRQRRTAEEPAGPSRPHGKQPIEARPAVKHLAMVQPGAMKRSVKKAHRAAPSAGPKRAVPTAIGNALELAKVAAAAVATEEADRRKGQGGAEECEAAETTEEVLAARQSGTTLEDAERDA